MNTIILIVLIMACSYMELSPKVDTDNVFEKAGVGIIVFGAGLDVIGNIHTNLVTLGMAIYFSTIAWRCYIAKHNRRKQDNAPRKRKILS